MRGAKPGLLLACVALLGPLACAGAARDRSLPPARPAPAPKPAFWRAHAPGYGDLYLLGSVHVGEAGAPTFAGSIARAWARADELVVEVDVSRITPEDVAALTQRYATLPPHLRLDALLAEDTRERLAGWVAARGVQAESLQRLKPWFVAQLVMITELRRIGYDAAFGVDRVFIDQASGVKPIVGLETVPSQFAALDGQPLEVQTLMLDDVLLRIDELEEHTRTLVEAWARGDEATIEREILDSLDQRPELAGFYEAFWWQRNQAMARRLVELAGDGETRFVTLGAGHMVGAKGIPALLAAQGFALERLGEAAAPGSPAEAAPAPR
jgi:hypothetical protein